ncbi:MAG: hypothetical protein ACREN8_14030, partial [Candidatus Dormibacteraceae bacterium]
MTDSRGFLRGHLWGAPRLLWVGVAVILILGLAGGFLAVHLASNNSSSGGTITTQLTGSTVAPTDSNAAQGPTASTDGSVLYQTGPGGSLQSVPTANPQQVQTVVPSGVTYFAPGPTPSEYAYVQGHTVHYGNRHRDFNGTIIRICFDSDQLIVVTVTDVERFDDGGVVIKFPGGEVAQQADFDFGGDRLAYLGGGHDLHIVDLASLKDVSYGQVDHFGSWSLDRNDVYAYVNTGGLFTVTATSENDDWQRVRVTDINISVTQVRWSSTGRVFLGSPQGLVSFDRDGNNRQDTPGDFSGHFTFIPNHPNSLAFDRGNNFSLSTNIPP